MRSELIRLAASLPKGDETRREILTTLSREAGMDEWSHMFNREFHAKLVSLMQDFTEAVSEAVSSNTMEDPKQGLRVRTRVAEDVIKHYAFKIITLIQVYTRNEFNSGILPED